MKPSLVVLIACCVVTTSAVAAMNGQAAKASLARAPMAVPSIARWADDDGNHPPRVLLADDDGNHPPRFAFTDDDGNHPPRAS